MSGLAGIVLAGGAARRLSGVDKPMLEVGGMPLLHRAVGALRGAEPVVVVGPERPGLPGVRWTREDPPGSGPVAALAAGLRLLPAESPAPVAVLAADLPAITEHTVRRLRDALGSADGAVLVDADGHRQWLIGVWRATALRAALPGRPEGAALRATLGGLSIVDVPARAGEAADVDTPEDLGGGLHSGHTG
ncbi:molybdopterin-guanine dinucleotide biosynthesis protein A [Prauserella shujinwangii]|uniref:Molybdopterin-guanine dinucleotide biosynthesis protein A n=1 Tax=Prauserella shujinwangii TaxID=1453103 RepID=A0A2T0LPF3_9PSEU|nr:NTP transferase domain-containing protein [Prauserella shujinwangii]PRX45113.1 molybdopterin-guanine dinucleotide biosynthesis protein A [Prauserella shujinwangii]